MPMSPMLPPELEKAVFQQAAYESPHSIPTMMRVAWRFKIWLEPMLYNIMTMLGTRSQHPLRGYPMYSFALESEEEAASSSRTALIASSLRQLCINAVALPEALRVLPGSTSIDNLWISTDGWDYPLWPLIGALRPRRLHCYLETLLYDPRHPIGLDHDFFGNITHLEILRVFHVEVVPEICEGLEGLGNLTHLAFNDWVFVPMSMGLLRGCAKLRVLVFLGPQTLDVTENLRELCKEARFVQMSCTERIKDWHMGAVGGVDYWSRAEEFVEMRRRGEVDPLQFAILDEESERLL
ncbi:hypothetical protein FB45DRAFT_901413 [Roridomyces roridus]|uniref:Uncharacterized protein n=1 Tax=Roridomyces roridus TaxID=1738132 RepID=A0AAD7C8J2_9AGAR|nr:hypothetical protein FB45DRAFT_901413 [Roridomyces roridus]